MDWPILQVALDFTSEEKALEIAEKTVNGGADWLEAGTPLIKSEGIKVVRDLKARYPEKVIVADLKTLDKGFLEAELASSNGADVITVSALSGKRNITDAVEGAKKNGAKVMADLMWVRQAEALDRAIKMQSWGVDYLALHAGFDDALIPSNLDPYLDTIHQVANSTRLPIAAVGSISAATAKPLVSVGAKIIVVGSAIILSPEPEKATKEIVQSIKF